MSIAQLSEKELQKLVNKIRKQIQAKQQQESKFDGGWPARRKELEAKLLKAKPHLAEQTHCQLIIDDVNDAPRRKVVMSNGVVLYTTWYKVPTTEADAKRALNETLWFRTDEGKRHLRATMLGITTNTTTTTTTNEAKEHDELQAHD